MCCNQRVREEFSCSNIGLEHHDPSRFTRFEWGWPKVYLIWRGVMAAYHLAMVILTGMSGRHDYIRTEADYVKWFIYETHWMYFTLASCAILEFAVALYCNLARSDIIRGEAKTMPIYLRVTWVWQNLANNTSLKVSIMYWAHMYAPPHTPPKIDMVTHLGSIVYVLVNLFITASPVRFYHFFHSLIFVAVYIVFTLFYFVAGGTNGLGYRWIYPKWDWETDPGTAALNACLGGFVICIAVQLVLLFVYLLRVNLFGSCVQKEEVDGERTNLVTTH